jgi:hypothetical protein
MRAANCIRHVLEDANINLGFGSHHVLEVGGWGILQAFLAGEQDGEKLAERARGKLRATVSELSA